jgi:hypothetical protein
MSATPACCEAAALSTQLSDPLEVGELPAGLGGGSHEMR